MLNHDTGQMDWDRDQIGPPANGYINPQNLYDPMTHVGRELLGVPSQDREFSASEPLGERGSKILFLAIIAIMFVGFFIIPGHS
ncbi:hypothetical protein [Sphingomonas zeae]